eukprot:Polyplicarium_translucidae@DN1562_c0_g1_i1.p6
MEMRRKRRWTTGGNRRTRWTCRGGEPDSAPRPKEIKTVTQSTKKQDFDKYLAPRVPFPYENARQYEASLRQPVGPEWNTVTAHHKFIEPQLRLRAGSSVLPMKLAKALPEDEVDTVRRAWGATQAARKARPGATARL